MFTWFFGQIFHTTLLIYLQQTFWAEEIPEESQTEMKEASTQFLLISIGLIFWLTVTAILSVGLLSVDYREELAESLNQILTIDSQLQQHFDYRATSNMTKTAETLMELLTFASLLFPLVVGLIFLTPVDPIRNMIEDILEIEFTLSSPYTWSCATMVVYSAFLLSGNGVSWITIIFLLTYILTSWLDATTPNAEMQDANRNRKLTFRTKNLGNASEETIVHVYRSLQVLTGIFNCGTSKLRLAYHGVVLLLIAAIAGFALIHGSEMFLVNGSLIIYFLAIILAGAFFTVVFIFYMECNYIDRLDCRWKLFRDNLLYSRKRSGVYKTAISFQPITVGLMQPFCHVNLSTFPEWFNIVIDRLVDLLLTF